jgi:hypothetical protein
MAVTLVQVPFFVVADNQVKVVPHAATR